MTPRPPAAVAALILVCGLIPLTIVIPYLWTGQVLRGFVVAAVQLVAGAIGLFGALFLTINYLEAQGAMAGNALPVVTMPLGCMIGAYAVSAICAWRAYQAHAAAQAA